MIKFFGFGKKQTHQQCETAEMDDTTDALMTGLCSPPSPILPDELMCVDSVPMAAVACMYSWNYDY